MDEWINWWIKWTNGRLLSNGNKKKATTTKQGGNESGSTISKVNLNIWTNPSNSQRLMFLA